MKVSPTARCPVGFCIYVPEGHAPDSTTKLPVIYNLHVRCVPLWVRRGPGLPILAHVALTARAHTVMAQGAGGNEFHSFVDVACLHAGITAGRWPPTIMVLPNGGWTWCAAATHAATERLKRLQGVEMTAHALRRYKNSWDGRFPVRKGCQHQ